MAELDIFNIETPQQVLARVRSARGKQLHSGNANQVRAAASSAALDQLFGNKEVDAATATDQAVKQGMLEAETTFAEDGVTDPAQQQMLRLDAIRRNVQGVSPSLALKIEDQVRQLRVADLERQKLTQAVKVGDDTVSKLNDRYLFNPDTLQTEKVDIGNADGLEKYQAAGEQGHARADKESSLLNLFNSERGRQYSADVARLDRIAELEEKANEGTSNFSLTKTRRTQMQKVIEANTQLTDSYRRAAELMQTPGMTTQWINKVSNFTMSVKDLANVGLSTEEIKSYTRYREIVQQTQGAANRLIKERSGAAVTEQEWERLKIELPTVHDSPAALAKKMQVMYDILRRSNRRLDASMAADDYRLTLEDGEKYAKDSDFLFGKPKEQDQPAQPASGGFKILGYEDV